MTPFSQFVKDAKKNGMIYYPGAGHDLTTMIELFRNDGNTFYDDQNTLRSPYQCKSKKHPGNPLFVCLDADQAWEGDRKVQYWLDNLKVGDEILDTLYGPVNSPQAFMGIKVFLEAKEVLSAIPDTRMTDEALSIYISSGHNSINSGYYFELKIVDIDGPLDIIPFYYLICVDEVFMKWVGTSIDLKGIIYQQQAAFSGRNYAYEMYEFFWEFISNLSMPNWVISDIELDWLGYNKTRSFERAKGYRLADILSEREKDKSGKLLDITAEISYRKSIAGKGFVSLMSSFGEGLNQAYPYCSSDEDKTGQRFLEHFGDQNTLYSFCNYDPRLFDFLQLKKTEERYNDYQEILREGFYLMCLPRDDDPEKQMDKLLETMKKNSLNKIVITDFLNLRGEEFEHAPGIFNSLKKHNFGNVVFVFQNRAKGSLFCSKMNILIKQATL